MKIKINLPVRLYLPMFILLLFLTIAIANYYKPSTITYKPTECILEMPRNMPNINYPCYWNPYLFWNI